MMVRRLEHYNIRTTRFDETVQFYDQALGMKAARPPMMTRGYPTRSEMNENDAKVRCASGRRS